MPTTSRVMLLKRLAWYGLACGTTGAVEPRVDRSPDVGSGAMRPRSSNRDEVRPASDPDGPSIIRSFRHVRLSPVAAELHIKDTEMSLICSSVRCGLTIDRVLALKCSACHRVYYCGPGCQREDWKALSQDSLRAD